MQVKEVSIGISAGNESKAKDNCSLKAMRREGYRG